MTFTAIIELIIAILKAPAEIRALVLLFSKSPEEKKMEIVAQVNAWMNKSSGGSRPEWETYERP
jgi:hypothetical protein